MWPPVGKLRPILACAIALLGAVAGCQSADRSLYPANPVKRTSETIVLDNHWHTALIFNSADLPEDFRAQLGGLASSRYVMIGWGDEGFFRAEHITVGLALQALFYSRGSVMLVVGFDDEPEVAFDPGVDIYRIPTSDASVQKTAAAVIASFRRKGEDVIDAGPGIDGGRFFAANGRYAFYHTCNQWTADCLAAGGLPITGAYAETAGNLAFQVRQLPGVLRNGLAVPKAELPIAKTTQLSRPPMLSCP